MDEELQEGIVGLYAAFGNVPLRSIRKGNATEGPLTR